MSTGKNRRAALSWLFVAGLFVLCGVLGVLQYRWIGEVSVAARDRLRGSLQASLNRLSLDFSTEIATAARGLLPASSPSDSPATETEVAARYAQWKKTARRLTAIYQREDDGFVALCPELDISRFSNRGKAKTALIISACCTVRCCQRIKH